MVTRSHTLWQHGDIVPHVSMFCAWLVLFKCLLCFNFRPKYPQTHGAAACISISSTSGGPWYWQWWSANSCSRSRRLCCIFPYMASLARARAYTPHQSSSLSPPGSVDIGLSGNAYRSLCQKNASSLRRYVLVLTYRRMASSRFPICKSLHKITTK